MNCRVSFVADCTCFITTKKRFISWQATKVHVRVCIFIKSSYVNKKRHFFGWKIWLTLYISRVRQFDKGFFILSSRVGKKTFFFNDQWNVKLFFRIAPDLLHYLYGIRVCFANSWIFHFVMYLTRLFTDKLLYFIIRKKKFCLSQTKYEIVKTKMKRIYRMVVVEIVRRKRNLRL